MTREVKNKNWKILISVLGLNSIAGIIRRPAMNNTLVLWLLYNSRKLIDRFLHFFIPFRFTDKNFTKQPQNNTGD